MIGLLSLYVSIYSVGYVKGFLGRRSVTSLVVFFAFFLAGMLLVVLSDDAFIFLVSWEVMAASSYFLVLFEDERVENRRAAFLLSRCRPRGGHRHPPVVRGDGGPCHRLPGLRRVYLRRHAEDGALRRMEAPRPFSSRSSGSAPRPARCPSMSGCPRRTPWRRQMYRPS